MKNIDKLDKHKVHYVMFENYDVEYNYDKVAEDIS